MATARLPVLVVSLRLPKLLMIILLIHMYDDISIYRSVLGRQDWPWPLRSYRPCSILAVRRLVPSRSGVEILKLSRGTPQFARTAGRIGRAWFG